jgi:adenosine kinase
MDIVLTGSIAFDYLMSFPGRFTDHLLPGHLDHISLSFLVDTLVRRRGGIAANIAYTLALLGERPKVMATVGEDFEEYREWLECHGVDTAGIRAIPGLFTASYFVNTDQTNAQIASFYTGAMARASELRFADLPARPDLVMVSPNDPAAMAAYVGECRAGHIPYLYDPSQQIVRLEAATLREGIEGSEGLFVNDYEFALIEDKVGMQIEAAVEAAGMVVITRGAEGADLYARGSRIHVAAVPPRAIADPTGVGDAFRGGFLKGHLHGLRLETCGRMGALAGTWCLECEGPQGHNYTLGEFIARLREEYDDHGELDRLT